MGDSNILPGSDIPDGESASKWVKEYGKQYVDQMFAQSGLDQMLIDASKKDPDRAKALLLEYKVDMKNVINENGRIEWENAFRNMALTDKFKFLIRTFVGGTLLDSFLEKDSDKAIAKNADVASSIKTRSYKDLYDYCMAHPDCSARAIEGSPHLNWPVGGPLDGINALKTLGKLKDPSTLTDINEFPFVPKSRWIINKSTAEAMDNMVGFSKVMFKSMGLKLSLVLPGETPKDPADDEIQIVCVFNMVPTNATGSIDWDAVKWYKEKILNSAVPCQISMCAPLLAASFVMDGTTPDEACKKAYFANPPKEFLDMLATCPKPAEPAKPVETPPLIS